MATKKNVLVYVLLIAFLVFIDYISKEYFKNKSIIIINNIIEIEYVRNSGLIYGLFKGNLYLTILLPLIILIFTACYFIFDKKYSKYIIPGIFIMAGILGNLISRIVYGYVIDWIKIPFLILLFPNFNIADMLTFIGVISLLVMLSRKK
ncbi:MAG: signal peptidase II [Nanoarchaeota archaeon]